MNDSSSIENAYSTFLKVQTEAHDRNKASVFDVLAAKHFTKVIVAFDGAGDSGQIEDISAFIGDTVTPLPTTKVAIVDVSRGSVVARKSEKMSIKDAIETLCYGYLSQMYGGWENNDGAFGEFTLDVATRSIAFEFNGRFTDYSTSSHTL